MTSYSFRLYVVSDSPHSKAAISNLKWICEQVLNGDCSISIVDVLQEPDEAERENILATPTLVRSHPSPEKRLIGDLADKQLVLSLLGLDNLVPKNRTDETE